MDRYRVRTNAVYREFTIRQTQELRALYKAAQKLIRSAVPFLPGSDDIVVHRDDFNELRDAVVKIKENSEKERAND